MKKQRLKNLNGIDPFTLAFASRAMEQEYSLDTAHKRVYLNRIALILAVVMYASFFIVDLLLKVPHLEAQAWIRLVIVPLSLLVVLAATWNLNYPKFGERLIGIPLMFGTFGHIPMAYLNGTYYGPGFFSFAMGLMLLYNFLLSGIRFRFSLITGLIVSGSYQSIEFAFLNNSVEETITNQFFMSSVYILGAISNYIIERFSRKEFLYRLERESFIEQIREEKLKSERLLENILPKKIASELRDTGRVQAQRFDNVTIMFVDIVGFTRLTSNVPADVLVGSLHEYFSAIDHIIRKYNLEKLKTVGDGYLCAGGLPRESETHALDCCMAAQEIVDYVCSRHSDEFPIKVRIGINTGMVMAGIVGLDKFAYDIWGDAVNVACRLEQVCEPNRINISESTKSLVEGKFETNSRGTMDLKGKGYFQIYYLGPTKSKQVLAS